MKAKTMLRMVMFVLFALVLVATPLLIGCGGGEEATPTPQGTAGPTATQPPGVLKIGVVSPFSGAGAVWGIPLLRLCELDRDEINAAGGIKVGGKTYMVELIPVDDEYTSEGGKNAAEKLVYSDKVKFIIGSIGSTPSLAMQTVTEPNGVMMIPSGQSPALLGKDKPLTFRLSTEAAYTPAVGYSYLQNNEPNVKTIAMMSSNDDFGKAIIVGCKVYAEQIGLQVVAEEYFERGAQDFYPLLTRVLAANPDVIELGGAATADCGLLVKQARELGYEGLMMNSSAGVTPSDFVDIAGVEAAEGFLNNIFNYQSPLAPPEAKAFAQRYLTTGEPFASIIFNVGKPVWLLKGAIEEANSLDPQDVADVLEDVVWDKGMGDCFFAGDDPEWYGIKRQAMQPLAFAEFQDGEPVTKFVASSDELLQFAQRYYGIYPEPEGQLTVALPTFLLEDVLPDQISAATNSYSGHMYDPVVGVNSFGQLSSLTGIATSWSTPDGGLTWNFTLRSGVKFHNGEDLTAEDVKFSIDLIRAPEAKSSSARVFQEQIEDVIVVSPTELTVKMKAPNVEFPVLLSPPTGSEGNVLPKDYYTSVGRQAFRENPIGSGPWKFVSREIGVNIKFEANEDYWGRVPGFKDLTILVVPEDSTRIAMLQTGEADMIDLPKASIGTVEAQGFKVVSIPFTACAGVQLFRIQEANMSFHDKDVRKALALAIDKEEILDKLFAGKGEVASGYLYTPPMEGYDSSLVPYPYDPDTAEQLLQGKDVEIKLWSFPVPGAPDLPKVAQAIAGYWTNVGVDVEIYPSDFATIRAAWGANPQQFYAPGEAALFIASTGASSLPNTRWYAISKEAGGLLHLTGEFAQDAIDDLYAEAGTKSDAAERAALLREVNEIMYDEYLTIPIVYYGNEYALGPDIKSWRPINGSFSALALNTVEPN